MKVLVLDVGGTHVKALATKQSTPRRIESGPKLTPALMAKEIRALVTDWKYDAVSVGYPGLVIHGRIGAEPHNLGPGWMHFDFARAFGKPVKLVNDAAMQALGSYEGGRMLFLGLGTGLGSAMIVGGEVQPMELAHLPFRKGRTYEDELGKSGLTRSGKKKWRKRVFEAVELLRHALEPDDIVVGGGNVKKLKELPAGVREGANSNAFAGGFRLWEPPHDERFPEHVSRTKKAK